MKFSYKKETGFTFVEMIVILAILSMLAMIMLPNLSSTVTQQQYEQFFRQFERDFLYFQQKAITEHTRFEIVFNETAQNYEVRHYIGKGLIHRRSLPNKMTYSFVYLNDNRIRIHPNGNVSQGGRVGFAYEMGKERKSKVFIFQIGTGRFQAEDW